MILVGILVALIFLYSLVSARLERTIVTAPLVFATAGTLCNPLLPEGWDGGLGHETMLAVAELGLVLLLFTDASRTELGVLRQIRALPARLLSVGMLATIALGTGVAAIMFADLSWWQAAILAAILAPTDAGLGQVIVESERVPIKVRQALNVEAGLNDGLTVPFLLFFMALAGFTAAGDANLLRFIGEQLGLGTVLGVGLGLLGGTLLERADSAGWMAPTSRQLGVVAIPVLAVICSPMLDASMFIAAFVAGLVIQTRFPEAATHSVEFTEEWGKLINLSVFFLFGLLLVRAAPELEWRHVVYALLSLTVIRMLPVALALAGAGLSRATVLFIGWFGPRGLASIVLGLVYLEQHADPSQDQTVRLTVMATVAASIILHGLSALPGIATYAGHVERLPPDAIERELAGPR
jgi:NhaP-type Na+/H+ or K+/H+ antiporter